MATTVRELINVVGWKVDKNQLNNAESLTNKFMSKLKTIGLTVGAGILAIGTAAIKSAADMEALTAQFEVMLGSAEKANVFVKELQNFSKVTPFQLKDLAENAKTMLAFGIAEQDVMKNLQMLGDVAGNSGEKLGSLTLAFSQIQSTGRLMGQDLLQLINAGFNPLSILAKENIGKKLGLSIQEVTKQLDNGTISSVVFTQEMSRLKDEMSKGGVSAEQVSHAFTLATSEGGLFFENMKKQSQTLVGLISTMKDNINLVLIAIGNKLLPAMKNIVQRITDLFQGSLGDILGKLLQVIDPLTNTLLSVIEMLSKSLMPIIDTLTKLLIPAIELINALLPLVQVVIEELLGFINEGIKALAGDFIPLFEELTEFLNIMMPILKPILQLMTRIALIFLKLNTFLPNLLFKIWVKGFTLILNLINNVLGLLKRVTPAFNIISNIIQGISDFIQNIFNNITQGITNSIMFVFEMLNKAINEINKLPFMKETQIKPFDIDALQKELIKKENNQTNNNINMTNNNTFNGVDTSQRGRIKNEVRDAMATPFNMEILRVLGEL